MVVVVVVVVRWWCYGTNAVRKGRSRKSLMRAWPNTLPIIYIYIYIYVGRDRVVARVLYMYNISG